MTTTSDEIAALEARRAELFKLKEPIDAELVDLYEKIQKLGEKLVSEEKDSLTWMDLLAVSNNLGQAGYNEAQRRLRDMECGFTSTGGYRTDFPLRYVVQISLNYKQYDLIPKLVEGIKQIAHAVSTNTENGETCWDIFDHDLAASRNPLLLVSQDFQSARIVDQYDYDWKRKGKAKHEGTLEEMLKLIADEYWYER